MYLFGLKVRVFQWSVVLGLHPFLVWLCCALSGRHLLSFTQIRQWELRNRESIQAKRSEAAATFVQKTDMGQLNQKENPSNKLAFLTLNLALAILCVAAITSVGVQAAINAGLKFDTSALVLFSGAAFLAIAFWLLRKAIRLLIAHYHETCFMGQLHASRGTTPWDGLF